MIGQLAFVWRLSHTSVDKGCYRPARSTSYVKLQLNLPPMPNLRPVTTH
jgi:hypothetical protein